MVKKPKLGIWMDHSVAHLTDYPADPLQTRTIECSFTHQAKEEALQRGESTMHNKEQSEQAAYYKELAEVIRQYDDVLIFGPTEAKTELYDTFKDNHLYSTIKVGIKPADKMTENQMHAFIKGHFEGEIN